MKFEPLAYVWGTLTPWHFGIWLGLTILIGLVLPATAGGTVTLATVLVPFWMFAVAYGIFALIFGQIFGDKYGFLQILPSGFILITAFMMLPFFAPLLEGRAEEAPPLTFFLFALPIFGLFGATFMWLAPRIVGFGPVGIPKMPWGVSL